LLQTKGHGLPAEGHAVASGTCQGFLAVRNTVLMLVHEHQSGARRCRAGHARLDGVINKSKRTWETQTGRRRMSEGSTRSQMQLSGFARACDDISRRLASMTDRVCVGLMGLLVLDVWLGVFARYVWPLPITFMEEAARYLMIWIALLAVSSCIRRREHIGMQMLFVMFPRCVQRILLGAMDLLGILFFLVLFYYGLGMVERGARVSTMIYGISKQLPFAAVPVSAALAITQLALVAVRDQLRLRQDSTLVVCP